MAKSPEEMAQSMIANMPEKTGKSLQQWVKIIKATKLSKHGDIVKMLKTDHGMTHGFANLAAHSVLKSAASTSGASDADLVEAQYAGDKANLKPIYEAIVNTVTAFGKDVEIAPKKANVSLRRNKQFALIQPTTKTRVDLGINIKGKAPEGKLEASGSFNAMVSHRVRLESVKDVDAQVKKWLKEAYQGA